MRIPGLVTKPTLLFRYPVGASVSTYCSATGKSMIELGYTEIEAVHVKSDPILPLIPKGQMMNNLKSRLFECDQHLFNLRVGAMVPILLINEAL